MNIKLLLTDKKYIDKVLDTTKTKRETAQFIYDAEFRHKTYAHKYNVDIHKILEDNIALVRDDIVYYRTKIVNKDDRVHFLVSLSNRIIYNG